MEGFHTVEFLLPQLSRSELFQGQPDQVFGGQVDVLGNENCDRKRPPRFCLVQFVRIVKEMDNRCSSYTAKP